MLRNSKPKTFRLLDKIPKRLRQNPGNSIKGEALVLLLALALLGGSAYLAVQKGTAFMPEMESTQASMTIIPRKALHLRK